LHFNSGKNSRLLRSCSACGEHTSAKQAMNQRFSRIFFLAGGYFSGLQDYSSEKKCCVNLISICSSRACLYVL